MKTLMSEANFLELFCHKPDEVSPLLWADRISTPQGDMLVIGDQNALVLMEFFERKNLTADLARISKMHSARIARGRTDLHRRASVQLGEYFAGKRAELDLPYRLLGTPFQNAVWEQLRAIPAGKTWSYKQLAAAMDRPKGAQAVANANSKNRLCLLIPCHRVIGIDGKMVGYGAGVDLKRQLLELERRG